MCAGELHFKTSEMQQSTPSEPALPIAPPRYALAAYGARRVRAQDDAIEQQATDACAGASEDSNASRAPSAADMVSAVMPAMRLGAIEPARTPARHSRQRELGLRSAMAQWTMAEAWPAAAVDGAEGGRGAWSAAAVKGAQGEDEGADGARSATVAEGSARPTRKAGEEAGRETVSRGPRRGARGWLQRVSCSGEYKRPMLGCVRCRRQTVALAAREADAAASTSVSKVHYLALGPIGR
ncbi:hypothetical protein T492DRAFT_854439 [Pavlovales sp. CCMP2436]|nr:hypothetical protein T492DRAFT_854439 [Pavlovales sp. CCMP2436]